MNESDSDSSDEPPVITKNPVAKKKKKKGGSALNPNNRLKQSVSRDPVASRLQDGDIQKLETAISNEIHDLSVQINDLLMKLGQAYTLAPNRIY